MNQNFAVMTLCVATATLASRAAYGDCNIPNSGSCISELNSATNGFGINASQSIFTSNSDAFAVFATSNSSNTSSAAVSAQAAGGIAVTAFSSTFNAVVGQNNRTDFAAAAISALPGNTNGLALYAGGGAEKPGGGSWSSTSDVRVKKDVRNFTSGLADLKRLRPVTYKYNGLGGTQDDGHEFVGVLAQELEKVMPSMVQSHKGKLHPGDAEDTDIKHVDPSAFTYMLINAVQEQQTVIERQNARIAALERGGLPRLASSISGGLGCLAVGLVPLGLIAVRQKRRRELAGDQGDQGAV